VTKRIGLKVGLKPKLITALVLTGLPSEVKNVRFEVKVKSSVD